MATNAPASQNSTAVRPRTVFLGVDGEGDHHCYRTQTETVHVVDPDAGRTRVEDVDGRPIEDWLAYVTHERGDWLDRRYGVGLVEMLADVMEPDA